MTTVWSKLQEFLKSLPLHFRNWFTLLKEPALLNRLLMKYMNKNHIGRIEVFIEAAGGMWHFVNVKITYDTVIRTFLIDVRLCHRYKHAVRRHTITGDVTHNTMTTVNTAVWYLRMFWREYILKVLITRFSFLLYLCETEDVHHTYCGNCSPKYVNEAIVLCTLKS